MPNIYCPSCAQAIKYLYARPEKCSCGHSFAAQLPVVQERVTSRQKDDDDDGQTFVTTSFRKKLKAPRKIGVEVDNVQAEKLGDIIGSNPGEKREKRPSVSKADYKNSIFSKKDSSIDD
jgi:hypothetical protein